MVFNLIVFFHCILRGGHRFKNSNARRGYITCERCRVRRRMR